jgi:hypothetical protein
VPRSLWWRMTATNMFLDVPPPERYSLMFASLN